VDQKIPGANPLELAGVFFDTLDHCRGDGSIDHGLAWIWRRRDFIFRFHLKKKRKKERKKKRKCNFDSKGRVSSGSDQAPSSGPT